MPAAPASSLPSSARVPVAACPLCGGRGFTPTGRSAGSHAVVRCLGCELHLLDPQPSDAELAEIYHPNYSFFGEGREAEACVSRAKQATADRYLDLLSAHGVAGGRLLEVGCGDGDFLLRASQRGFAITGIDYSPHSCAKSQAKLGPAASIHRGEIALLEERRDAFDLCVACDVIEHVRRPDHFLGTVHGLLRPGGSVLLVTPDLCSPTARLMGPHWLEFKAEHLSFYTARTLRRQLANAGFTGIRLFAGMKMLSLDYVTRHFLTYPVPLATPALRALRATLPGAWQERLWHVPSGGLIALARKPSGTAP